jgi:preprotein translocase subunit YajC
VLLAESANDGGGGNLLFSLLPFILIIAAMYFLLIRPNSKRRREEQEMQRTLSVGSEVRTAGGLYGTVVATDDESVTLEAAPGVELRFARGAIARVLSQPESEADEDLEDETDEEPSDSDTDRGSRKTD